MFIDLILHIVGTSKHYELSISQLYYFFPTFNKKKLLGVWLLTQYKNAYYNISFLEAGAQAKRFSRFPE